VNEHESMLGRPSSREIRALYLNGGRCTNIGGAPYDERRIGDPALPKWMEPYQSRFDCESDLVRIRAAETFEVSAENRFRKTYVRHA
jgi:hypothetical protein